MSSKIPPRGRLGTMQSQWLSRRTFLRTVGTGSAIVAGGGLLSACGNDPDSSSASSDNSTVDQQLNVANWPLYIDSKRVDGVKTYPSIEGFEQKSGVTVNYTEPINDMEEFFAKIRPVLSNNGDTGWDMFMLTDWTVARLLALDWLQPLDRSNIPNADNVVERLKSPPFDPDRSYSIPWQSGITGIAYDGTQTRPITSISDLLTNPDLAGSVSVLKDMRDTTGLVMLDQGSDPGDFTDDEFSAAIDTLQTARDSGHIRQFTGNNYAQLLGQGDVKACIAWSGDIFQLQLDNPDIKFVVPEAGGMLWSDNMVVPNEAQHKTNAELWMNYYCQPAVAAQLSAWVNYICPIEGAQEEMAKIDESLAENPLIFPSAQDYAALSIFRGLSAEEDAKYTGQFQQLVV
ncbi:MAG TPA: spermidine/putrescine ABC transporter substrate-binding protein [Actinomycetes bacterium]|nr:spermidine/putrescine ABC transporter substrate-binding protein [Actinomycetes bacterium]